MDALELSKKNCSFPDLQGFGILCSRQIAKIQVYTKKLFTVLVFKVGGVLSEFLLCDHDYLWTTLKVFFIMTLVLFNYVITK